MENTYLAGQDLHGTAAVIGYYRQLVLNGLQAQLVASGITPVANPEQCWFTPTPAELANSTLLTKALQAWIAPKGCTGFEQMLTPAAPTGAAVWSDSLDVTPQGYPYAAPPYNITAYVPRSIFQPGDPELHFMADPVDAVGFDNNTIGPEPAPGVAQPGRGHHGPRQRGRHPARGAGLALLPAVSGRRRTRSTC